MQELRSPLLIRSRGDAVVDIGLGLLDLRHRFPGVSELVVLHSHHILEHIQSLHTHTLVRK